MIKLGDKIFEYEHYPDGTLNIKLNSPTIYYFLSGCWGDEEIFEDDQSTVCVWQ